MTENEDDTSRFERAREFGQAALVPAAKALFAGGLSMAGVPEAAVAAEAAVDAAMGYQQQALQEGFEQRLRDLEADLADLTAEDADGRMRLAVDALQRARAHVHRQHAKAMGRVVAEAAVEPPRLDLDRAAVLLRIIDNLQAAHLTVLAVLAKPDDPDLRPEVIAERAGQPLEDVQWILSDLARHNLVSYEAVARLLGFGRQVLDYFDA